ncbi:MAG: Rieske (2Fe-2S) domain protein [Myxococcaceae bacterium]|nr:Rieske (2Fe-2S) domain protein [Myxococcaceae bacterium]
MASPTDTEPTDQERERRRFLLLVGSGALGAVGLGLAAATLRFIEPNVLFEEDRRFAVGRPEDVPVGTVLVLVRQRVYVVREEKGFYALSAVCTHLGCITRYEAEQKGFFCPCHGSRYALKGTVTGGPAPAALVRLHLSIEREQLVVDAGRPAASQALLELPA